MSPFDRTQSGKIAVVHQGALGDFLLALPILEGLHRSYPRIRLKLWAKAEHVALFAEKSYIEKEHPPDDLELTPFFHDELWREAKTPRFFVDTLAILIFGQAGSRVLTTRLSARLPCPVQWLQSFPNPGSTQPVHHFLLEQCRQLGWSVEECLPQLKPLRIEQSFIQEYLRRKTPTPIGKPIVVHPGSGGLRKIWPLKNWWALFRFLVEQYRFPVYLTLGPADERLKSFAREAEKLDVTVLDGFSLPRLAAFLAESQLFIGSDSGVSHLAALMGIPTLAIFGPTDPGIWAPRGSNAHIIRESWEEAEVLTWSPDPPAATLSPHILEAVKNLLPSS
jgi:ADP-heptose:LPS heptosyltransferase